MNTRRLLVTFTALSLGFGQSSFAEEKPAPAKPAHGYEVTLEMKIDESGKVDDAKVISSEDKSADHVLDRIALEDAKEMKLAPRMKNGKAVAYIARAPFKFDVENDEGVEAANTPEPHILNAVSPIYPADLAAKGEVGGVIFAMTFGVDGSVTSMKTLRASNPEFEKAAMESLKQWTFNPAKKDGVAVETRGYLTIGFETDVRRPYWNWLYPPRPAVGYFGVVHRTLPATPTAATGKTAELAK